MDSYLKSSKEYYMKFGISTFVWCSPFTTASFDIIPKVKEIGYDVFEVAAEELDLVDWRLLKKMCDDLGLDITLSGAFGLTRDISSEDASVRKAGMDYISDCLNICEILGSTKFGGPVYSAVGKTRFLTEEEKKAERERCFQSLKVVAGQARDSGVVIGLEPINRFENDMINTVDQALSLISEVDSKNIRLLIDTFHANIEEKSIPAAIRKAGASLCHIHGNENDRGTPGTGHTDWAGIKSALNETGYDDMIVIETFGAISKEIARAASIWRPLAESPYALAKEGLEFFKHLFQTP